MKCGNIKYLLFCLLISCQNQQNKKEFYSDGSLKAEEFYLNGAKHGSSTEYYRNGNIKTISTFFDGRRGDTIKGYYENGNLEFVQFKIDHDRDSIHIYDSTQTFVKSKGVVENNMILGWRSYYDKKGRLLEKLEFLKFDGEEPFINQAIFYDADGVVESTSYYYNVNIRDTIKSGEQVSIDIAYNPLISDKSKVFFIYDIDSLAARADAQKGKFDTLHMNLHKLSTYLKISSPGKRYLRGYFFEEDVNVEENRQDTTLSDISFTRNKMYFSIPVYVEK